MFRTLYVTVGERLSETPTENLLRTQDLLELQVYVAVK